MSLVLPSELIVDHFLPTFRSMLASELAERGLTQQEIATHLGVTQAAVSTYISDPQNGDEPTTDRFRTDPATIATAERLANGIADGSMSSYDALEEVLSLLHHLEDRGPLCSLHEETMPALQGLGCDLCIRGGDADIEAERAVLRDVRNASRQFSTRPIMAPFVPNVGTNIGMATPTPTDITDVAAIPGRIYTIQGRIHVPTNPEFGASQHVAHAILAASTTDPTMRGALNLVTNHDLLAVAREHNISVLEFDPDYDDRTAHLISTFENHGSVPSVIYHDGAFGIEPTTYVLGSSATDAVSLACELVEKLRHELEK